MNLLLFVDVLRRFKFLVLIGLVLALALATVSLARITFEGGSPHLEYRSEQRWESTALLFVTQDGFPWGRSVLDEALPVGPKGDAGYVPRYSDVNRFQTLAQIYAQFAMGDAVRRIILRDGRIHGDYDAGPVSSRDGSTFLPLVAVTGSGVTPAHAVTLARRVTDAFLLYLRQTQNASKIPADKRVDVQVVESPREATLVEGRGLTKPIFLFVLVMSAVMALTFTLENLRPRAPQAAVEVPSGTAHVPAKPTSVMDVGRRRRA